MFMLVPQLITHKFHAWLLTSLSWRIVTRLAIALARKFPWPIDTVILTRGVGRLDLESWRGLPNKIASLPLLSQLYTHPPVSIDLPSLLLQAGRRSLVSHIPLLHIRCPQCCSHRIRESEQNARNRHQFQQDSCNTEAITYCQYMSRAPKPPQHFCALMTYLVYAALYSSTCLCLCVLFHSFN